MAAQIRSQSQKFSMLLVVNRQLLVVNRQLQVAGDQNSELYSSPHTAIVNLFSLNNEINNETRV